MKPFIDSISNQACISIHNDALHVTIDDHEFSISQVSTVFIRSMIDGLMLLEDHGRGTNEILLSGGNPAFVLTSKMVSNGWRPGSRTHMIFEDRVYSIKNFRIVDIVVSPAFMSREDQSAIMRVAVQLLQASLR